MKKSLPHLIVSIYNWHFYPRMIDWKIKNRDQITLDNELKNTINVSILIDLTVYLEGFISKILMTAIEKRKSNENEFSNRITKHLIEKISDSTWSKYKENFETVLGIKLSDITKDENFRSINLLFDFRNILVHANDLTINYFYNEKGKEDYDSSIPNFNKIIKFLKEKKLINWDFSKFTDTDNFNYLIKDNIINFFHHESIEFLKSILNNLPEKERSDFQFHFPEYFEKNN